MVDPTTLRNLPPDRFGTVVVAVFEDAWPGDVDASPPSPGGVLDLLVTDGNGSRLVHVRQDTALDEAVVADVAGVVADRGLDAATIVTTGRIEPATRTRAEEADVELLDGGAFSALVESTGVEVPATA